MLERIEITGFQIIGNEVVTFFRINRIPTSTTGSSSTSSTSSAAVLARIQSDSFRADVLTQTVAAIDAEPDAAWTTDPVFSALGQAPTDSAGASGTSLFTSQNATAAVVVAQPTVGGTSCPSVNLYYDAIEGSCKEKVCTCLNGIATTGSDCETHNTENCASCTA